MFKEKKPIKITTKHFLFLLSIIVSSISSTEYPVDEKPMVIVSCMYNNAQWVLHNLTSVFKQNYTNKRMIIVDDASTDSTGEIIKKFIKENNCEHQITFIQNEIRKRKLANLYHALYLCDDHEIVVMVDGDDWLAHNNVLNIINKTYYDENVWMTYGQYYNVPPEEAIKWGYSPKGYASPVPHEQQEQHEYRKGPFRFMHLRTFYGWLFKTVKLEDLLSETVTGFKGCPFPASNDLAMYYPMIEQAHYHVRFIPNIIYIRNLFSEIVGFKIDRKIQIASAKEIRKKPSYPILSQPFYRNLDHYKNNPVIMIMIAENTIEHATHTFEQLQQQASGIGRCVLLYHQNLMLNNNFPTDITTISYDDSIDNGVGKKLQTILEQSEQEHLLFLTEHSLQDYRFDCYKAAYWMEKSFAKKVYFHQETSLKNYPWLVYLDDTIYAWKQNCTRDNWKNMDPLSSVLYRANDIKNLLASFPIKKYNQLMLLLKKYHMNPGNIALSITKPN